jgi:ribitol-5-phosphate 2-dehydrogenase
MLMLNTSFQLIDEKRIYPKIFEQEIDIDSQIIIRPKAISLCNADSRYFFGKRPREIMMKKLPIALGHEAIGTVVFDPKKEFPQGTNVVLVPNISPKEETSVSPNYDRKSKFCSSSTDGFMQELVVHDRKSIVVLPEKDEYIVEPILEFISVVFQAISRFEKMVNSERKTLAVWGDGNLGYISALVLKDLYPNAKVLVFGKHKDKLTRFSFVDETHLIDQIPSGEYIDHAFECVGGLGSQSAINQIIDVLKPEGSISLLGVTEEKVSINTRMVLEKGITLIGHSRSVKEDFERAVEFIYKNKKNYNYLKNVIAETIKVSTIEDIYEAFHIDSKTGFGKVVLKWEI